MKKLFFVFIMVASLNMLFNAIASAKIYTYHSKTAFLAALMALSHVDQPTLNFESLAQGYIIPSGDTVDGVNFTYTIGTDQIMVDDAFETTSAFNYIGLDNIEGAFLFGDSFTMRFDRAVHAVGLYVITEMNAALEGDFMLSAGAGTVSNSKIPDLLLADGDAFFLGLIETDFSLGFTSATLEASFIPGPGEDFLFNVDDITSMQRYLSLPAILMLLLLD